MATRVLSPAIVPSTLVPTGYGPTKLAPDVTNANIECGRFMYLDANGDVAIWPLVDTYFLDGEAITTHYGIAYITAEAFHTALAAADSVPFRQTDIGVIPLVPGVAVEMNLYEDGGGGAGETLAKEDLGDTVTFHRVAVGSDYVWTADKTNPTGEGLYVTGTIVRLMDEIGTINGRVLVTVDGAWRYAPFGFFDYNFFRQQ